VVELKRDRTSIPSLDDLDAGWGDAEEDEADEPEEPEEPEPPGLTTEQRVARVEAKKERARGKAAARLAKKERRKARALAAAEKKKAKQPKPRKKGPPPPERSAPSLRGVTSDVGDEAEADDEADARPVHQAARSPRDARPENNRQTLLVIIALALLAGGVAFYFLRK
jgi:hypothetical protein